MQTTWSTAMLPMRLHTVSRLPRLFLTQAVSLLPCTRPQAPLSSSPHRAWNILVRSCTPRPRMLVHLSSSAAQSANASVTAEFVPPAGACDTPVAPSFATEFEQGASLTTTLLTTPIDANYFAPCFNIAAQWLEHSNGLYNSTMHWS